MHHVSLGVATFAIAAALQSIPAQANDLGCQVLLCLSNPGGAKEYAQCVAPMAALWRRMATGGAYPSCSGSGVAHTTVYNRNSVMRRRVVIAFSDGRREVHSLAQIERLQEPAL